MSHFYELENVKFKSHEWSIISYPEYLRYISENSHDETSFDDLIDYVETAEIVNDFKWPIQIGTIQFLCGVFPGEKVVRVTSKQLQNELSILSIPGDNDSQEHNLMKEHAEAVATIPLHNTPSVIEYISSTNDLPLFDHEDDKVVFDRASELSEELVAKVSLYKQSIFEKFSDYGLDLTANFMLVRIHLLKYLAILPNLDHDKDGDEVKRLLLETFRRLLSDSQIAAKKGLKGQKRALPGYLIIVLKIISKIVEFMPALLMAKFTRFSVAVMAKRFIAGENINKASGSLKDLSLTGRDATIDQLGELVVSNIEADKYTNEVVEIIKGFNDHVEQDSRNTAGINRAHVSIKVSALSNDFKPHDFNYTFENVSPRLIKILQAAKQYNVFLNIDAEHYHYRDIVFSIYKKVLMENEDLISFSATGIVVQAYLRDGFKHLRDIAAFAKSRGIVMPIRLVKGAYWDAETIEADAHNFLAPEFLNKEETDIHFRQLIDLSLKSGDSIQLAVASHNIQDHAFAEALREIRYPEAPVIEHQCLHMTYEGLSVGLSKMGWPTRNYIPVGDLLVGMAYLVRRIMENSSQVGVLTIMRSHKKSLNTMSPFEVLKKNQENFKYKFDQSVEIMSKDFKNIYPIRSYLSKHLTRVSDKLNSDLKMLKDGKLFYDKGDHLILCSSDPKIELGKVTLDTPNSIETKISTLFNGYNQREWRDDLHFRFSSLKRLADLFLLERESLTSLIMLEAGKTIDEALADVDEAIDFINFYINEQVKIESTERYGPVGIVGVIAPWNFPLAIPCGMTVAALVAGNCVILKPAEQTPLIALKFLDLCREAGITDDILEIGIGEAEVGIAIVDHELVSGVVFTGSKAVGTQIYRNVSQLKTSSKYDFSSIPKFAITEMGGKNAIIVTNNCELDETVSGIIYASFAHAGQKCSAASRIIIDEQIKDSFVKRFSEAVKDINIGPSFKFSTTINPLVTKEDADRVHALALRSIEEVKNYGGKVIVNSTELKFDNYCVGPSVFELPKNIVLQESTVASEEVFGPLVHLISYKTLDEAIEIFNSTEYALTGGIFCQSQDDITYMVPKLEAGNIYVNRPSTGARVAIEPFGGFKMSGTGPKAGGVDYLYKFNRKLKRFDNISLKEDITSDSVPQCIASTSKLSRQRRIYNVKRLLTQLINQYESYFGEIIEYDKHKLENFKKALTDDEFDLDQRDFPNRYIPGQISFTRRDMSMAYSGVLIDGSGELSIQPVIDVLINLTLGNGVNILSSNSTIFTKWEVICGLAYSSGHSPYNLTLELASDSNIAKSLADQYFDFVILVNDDCPAIFKESIMNRDFSKGLTRVIHSGDNASWMQGLASFSHARSFAINTMRHGAPLDLEL